MGDYDFVDCSYGGLGNWRQGKRECMLCPHEGLCQEETSQAEAVPWRRSSRGGPLSRTRVAKRDVSPVQRSRSKRPSPRNGETMLSRLGKNVAASALAAIGHEFGDFWDDHDFASPEEKDG